MPPTTSPSAATGQRLSYDALLVAVGAGSEPAFRRVLTWTPETDAELFGGLLRDLDEGYLKRVAFVVPPGVAWALPAYELALMTAWQAWGMGHDDVEVTVYTPEDAPLGLFGTQATVAVRHDLEEAGVQAETGVYVAEDPQDPGRLILHPGERTLDAERVVALPRAVGPGLPGLPANARGFIPTDLHGRVPDVDGVWAAGDAIAFPVKQGGLASQQADAAAESIAAHAGADLEPRPYRPVLRGMMLTGRGKAWMHHQPSGGGEGTAARRALWWPPTKIAGRYLSPYLAARHGTDAVGEGPEPDGQPVELDLERECPRPPTRSGRRASAARPSAHGLLRHAPRRGATRKHPRPKGEHRPRGGGAGPGGRLNNRTSQTSIEPQPPCPGARPDAKPARCDRRLERIVSMQPVEAKRQVMRLPGPEAVALDHFRPGARGDDQGQ